MKLNALKFFSLILGLILSVTTEASAPIRVAVASNFNFPLKNIIEQYKKVSGQDVLVSTGSSGVLFAQITKGAPFDLFLSADAQRPQQLELNGLTVTGSRQTYAKGLLAYWRPNTENLNLNSLQTYSGRLAVANPRFAPYGLAAEQSLKALNIDIDVKAKVVGNNVIQAFQFVDSGNADAGIIPLSLLKRAWVRFGLPKYKNYILLPDDSYEPIEQQLVIIKSTKQLDKAKQFSAFLLSETAQNLLHSLGYEKTSNNLEKKVTK